MCSSWDISGRVHNHVTLNFKVIRQSDAYGSRLNEFPDPLNIGNKKMICKIACLVADIHLMMILDMHLTLWLNQIDVMTSEIKVIVWCYLCYFDKEKFKKSHEGKFLCPYISQSCRWNYTPGSRFDPQRHGEGEPQERKTGGINMC